VIDFVAIGLSAWIGVLEFFGDPPMKIAGFVVWWAGIDALQVVLGATLAVFLVPALRGAQQLWLVLIPSVVLGAAAGIVGWPISTASIQVGRRGRNTSAHSPPSVSVLRAHTSSRGRHPESRTTSVVRNRQRRRPHPSRPGRLSSTALVGAETRR